MKMRIFVSIIRTGSRGLYWLEPMIEVAGPQGRVAFGPVTVADVPSVLNAMADAAGITLAAIARADGFAVFTHPERIKADIDAREAAHVS